MANNQNRSNQSKARKILISGAGIAGLALARRFDSMGISYTLIEKKDSNNQSTAGITLPFNAIQALKLLHLDQSVLACAHQVNEIIYCKPSGNILAKASLLEPPLNQAPFIALERAQLHQILRQDLRASLKIGRFWYNHRTHKIRT